MSNVKHFGEHLTIDGYGGNKDLLNDKGIVLNLLSELPGSLGMHKLSEPSIIFAPGNNDKDPGGWSGFVIIAESHISIHTFPARGFLSADVYTCKTDMDTKQVVDIIKETFRLKDVETHFVIRGSKYPHENIY